VTLGFRVKPLGLRAIPFGGSFSFCAIGSALLAFTRYFDGENKVLTFGFFCAPYAFK
jgi:hypothetical protein